MQKVILFPGELKSTTSDSSELKRSDMNWPKKVQEIQEGKTKELKELLRPQYLELIKKLNQETVDSDRSRFLEKVRLSYEEYLHPNTSESTEYSLYYLLLYYLEKDSDSFYFTMDESDVVILACDGSSSTKATIFLIEQFYDSLRKGKNRTSIEMFLKAMTL